MSFSPVRLKHALLFVVGTAGPIAAHAEQARP
jgi:hypothetical protein